MRGRAPVQQAQRRERAMSATKRNTGFERVSCSFAIAMIVMLCHSAPAHAIEVAAGDWKFTANGNVNVYYIGSSCEEESAPAITGGLACRGAAGEDRSSSISNGLLPAAL